ncbi:ATP-binding protein [Candidatus Collierbacteria bacterium]|nr:ATP-binding protein [Candidatus Collierbacteria bacterium]
MPNITIFHSVIFNYVTSFLVSLSPYIVPLKVVLLALLFLYGCYQLFRIYLITKQLKEKSILFELQPLKNTEQSSYTTQQLFAILHGLAKQRTFLHRFFDVTKNYAFEIVSTKDGGITYYTRIGEDEADLVKKTLLSYLPGISVKETTDYLEQLTNQHKRISNYKLAGHFAYPLKHQDDLTLHDPIAYLTGSMTKLSEDDLIAFQVVLSPLRKSTLSAVSRISHLIYSGKDLVSNIRDEASSNPFTAVLKLIFLLIVRIVMLPIGILVFIATDGREGPVLRLPTDQLPLKTINPYQQELEQMVKGKLDQQLFTTSIRLMVASNNYSELRRRERGFQSALSTLNNSEYQALVPSFRLRVKFFDQIMEAVYKLRILLPTRSFILSATEISDLYHFPYTSTTKTEDLLKQHSKELPAPLSLKQKTALDIYFAKNTYGGTETKIGLTADERRRHVYILGATGTGKSTMLLSMIKQDVDNNKGLCVVDPHGDLIEQIISVISRDRIADVVYFNPDDIGYPMGINLLELTPGLSEEDTIREKEFIAESIISVFHKIYSDKYSGPRMEYILRNTIHTAFTIPDATLFTIYKLLINTHFRTSVVRNLTDENLKDFWNYEFKKAGDYQKVKMISPITNKIGRFLFSPTAKRILEQGKSTINFDTIMNEGKILLCNLSKGKIGEDNSEVFGVLIMAKIQLAALKRARMKQEDRKDFYLYVDEFQNFATPAFAQILSEARKYRLGAILAHQTTSQLEDISLVNITLANTGTVICFRTANPEDERVILPQFRPYVEQGEIASLPSYHFYMRLGALNPEEPFSGSTIPVKIEYSQNRMNEVIESSRKLYAKKFTQSVEQSRKSQEKQTSKRVYSAVP